MGSDNQSAITNPSVPFTDFNCLTGLVYVMSFAIALTMLVSKLNDAQSLDRFFIFYFFAVQQDLFNLTRLVLLIFLDG